MPVVRLETNVPQEKIPKDLAAKLADFVVKSLPGKPAKHVAVVLIGDVDMVWGGTADPAAIVALNCIGILGPEVNKKYSKAILDIVNQSMGIAPDRLYISFNNVAAEAVGYKGTTFAEILGR